MKKVFKSIIALCSALAISLGVISCATIKGKSKVESIVVTISVNDVEADYNFDLYLNYAPGTIEHFKHLATSGYYNDSAVSNVSGHLEFGAYKFADNGAFLSKYVDYASLINATYRADKYLYYGNDKNEMKDYPRYTGENIIGEFAANGYTGNSLGLDGALVLKRDIDTDIAENAYNTGMGTMAITFNNGDYYFNSASEFAILGSASKDDNDDGDSSYARLKKIMTEYEMDEDGNIYYYYSIGTAEYYEELGVKGYGHYFMFDAEDSCYRYDSNNDGKIDAQDEKIEDDADVEDDAGEIVIKELAENSVYLNTIPYSGVKIKIVKITFAK